MAEIPEDVFARFACVERKIQRAARRIAQGRPAGDSARRRRLHDQREAHKREAEEVAEAWAAAAHAASRERVIGRSDILLLGFFHAGLLAARSVGRLSVGGGVERATGFLVSPDMVMTNQHVLRGPDDARAAEIDFEDFDEVGTQLGTHTCRFDPDRFFFADEALDVTLVALEDSPERRAATARLGWHPMIGGEGKILIGDPVNIIQYPGGLHKSIVVHNSNLVHLENGGERDPFCWYSSDTQRGSSGAPVFNNRWEVIAVHHRSIPQRSADGGYLDRAGRPMTTAEYVADPERAVYRANEGTRTSRIVRALAAARFADPTQARRRDDLLALWRDSAVVNKGQLAARAAGRRSDAAGAAETRTVETIRLDHTGAGVLEIHIHLHTDRRRD